MLLAAFKRLKKCERHLTNGSALSVSRPDYHVARVPTN